MKLSTRGFWIAGIVLSFFGVAVARWLSPQVPPGYTLMTTLAGQLLALGGLFVIALGTRKRRKRGEAEGS